MGAHEIIKNSGDPDIYLFVPHVQVHMEATARVYTRARRMQNPQSATDDIPGPI
jgi:hypothetical protein